MCRKSGKNEEDGNTPKPPEKLQNGALKIPQEKCVVDGL
jgi:hypothetical protein